MSSNKRKPSEEFDDNSNNKKSTNDTEPQELDKLDFEDDIDDIEEDDIDPDVMREASIEYDDPDDNDNVIPEGEEIVGDDENDNMDDEFVQDENVMVWNPDQEPLNEGETLEYDSTAYDMLHFMSVDWPCFSFDILRDNLGGNRTRFPHTAYVVAGSQADIPENNQILIMKMSDLHKTKYDNASESGSDSNSNDNDDDPVLEYKSIPHPIGNINKIRSMPQQPHIVASFSDNHQVSVWDFKRYIEALDTPPKQSLAKKPKPVFKFNGHPSEGFALDWSNKLPGRLATGDCKKNIYVWNPKDNSWEVDMIPYVGHQDSVEDLKWSPTEQDVFASCSVDKTIKFWDTRGKKQHVASINAHDSDVNVISWNHNKSFLILSGADDGTFRVWDLRSVKAGEQKNLFSFSYHHAPITSLTWNPNDDSSLAVSSEDNSVTFWDLSITVDTTEINVDNVPPQLMFVHRGQNYIKDIHFHPQIPGCLISTAVEGFNVLKPFNIS
jgi:ribosome assembly protein RRB1